MAQCPSGPGISAEWTRCNGLLAAGGSAMHVGALLLLPGGVLPDSVSPLGRAGPVPPQSWWTSTVDGRSPAGTGRDTCCPIRMSHDGVLLVAGRGFLGDDVSTFISAEASVRWRLLQDELSFVSRQHSHISYLASPTGVCPQLRYVG